MVLFETAARPLLGDRRAWSPKPDFWPSCPR